jgi:hypothetical protein
MLEGVCELQAAGRGRRRGGALPESSECRVNAEEAARDADCELLVVEGLGCTKAAPPTSWR